MIDLRRGDCLEVMKDIPDCSVDAIITDPPYGTTQCKWDSIIPFEPMWEQLKRIIKPNGAIVLTASQPFTSALVMSNPKMFKYDWTWRKPRGTGHLNAKRQPMRDKEDILVFYKSQPVYNPQLAKGEPYTSLKGGRTPRQSDKGATTYGKFMNGAEYRNDNYGFRYPKQVIDFGVVERGTVHPTHKPVALFEDLIKTYTNEGDLVLDNVAGSGTTGVACQNLNRNFILMEQEPEYVEIIKKRLAKGKEML